MDDTRQRTVASFVWNFQKILLFRYTFTYRQTCWSH